MRSCRSHRGSRAPPRLAAHSPARYSFLRTTYAHSYLRTARRFTLHTARCTGALSHAACTLPQPVHLGSPLSVLLMPPFAHCTPLLHGINTALPVLGSCTAQSWFTRSRSRFVCVPPAALHDHWVTPPVAVRFCFYLHTCTRGLRSQGCTTPPFACDAQCGSRAAHMVFTAVAHATPATNHTDTCLATDTHVPQTTAHFTAHAPLPAHCRAAWFCTSGT